MASEYPQLCAYGLKKLVDEAPLARSVLFDGLSVNLLLRASTSCTCSRRHATVTAVRWYVLVVDVAEDTADSEDNTYPPAEGGGEELPFNGVAFGVLPGVDWGSRMLMNNAMSFVSWSRMEMFWPFEGGALMDELRRVDVQPNDVHCE